MVTGTTLLVDVYNPNLFISSTVSRRFTSTLALRFCSLTRTYAYVPSHSPILSNYHSPDTCSDNIIPLPATATAPRNNSLRRLFFRSFIASLIDLLVLGSTTGLSVCLSLSIILPQNICERFHNGASQVRGEKSPHHSHLRLIGSLAFRTVLTFATLAKYAGL